MRRLSLLVLLAAAACGEPMCKRECERARPQLVRDFAAQVDCSELKWMTDDCVQCRQIFARDYGVQDLALTCEADAGVAP